MGEEVRAGVPLPGGSAGASKGAGACSGVKLVRPVPRVAVRMMRPQRG
jgi:hypothetical protein